MDDAVPNQGRRRSCVEGLWRLLRIAVDAKGAGASQLVVAVAAAQQTDAQHARSPGGEQIPDRIADDVALLGWNAEPVAAGEEEIRLRLRSKDVTALDDDDCGANPERVERGVDLGSPTGRCNPVRDACLAQFGEQLDRSGKRSPLGKQLGEELAMSSLDPFCFLRGERPPDLAGHTPV